MSQQDTFELPNGWVTGTASDLVLNPKNDIVDGPFGSNLKASEYTDSGTPIVRIQNVKRFRFVDKNIHFVTDEKAKQLKRHSFKAGDVLITKLGEPLGLACIAPNRLEFGIIVADIVRARPYIEISNKFMTYLLNSRVVIEQISKHTKGSTRARINLSVIRNLNIPIPPIAEQKRIVEKLDSLLAQVETIQQRLNNLPNIIKRFRQSVLAAAVSGKLTEQWRGERDCKSWKTVSLGDVVTPISQGWSPKCNNVPAPDGNWGVIKTSAVQSIQFVEEENKELPDTLEPREKLLIKDGDILVTRAGPRVRCGITCLVTEVKSKLMICDKVYRFQVKESHGINKFLVLQLNSLKYLEYIEKLKTGISDSGMNLTQVKFKKLRLDWPETKEQNEIVRLVEQHFALADTLEKNLKNAKQRVDNLTQSILAKAFRGELVPQDPNDEPAEQLLARIKTARAEAELLEKAAKKAAKAKK
jgi:type I restriction enzyme S subunit